MPSASAAKSSPNAAKVLAIRKCMLASVATLTCITAGLILLAMYQPDVKRATRSTAWLAAASAFMGIAIFAIIVGIILLVFGRAERSFEPLRRVADVTISIALNMMLMLLCARASHPWVVAMAGGAVLVAILAVWVLTARYDYTDLPLLQLLLGYLGLVILVYLVALPLLVSFGDVDARDAWLWILLALSIVATALYFASMLKVVSETSRACDEKARLCCERGAMGVYIDVMSMMLRILDAAELVDLITED
jgi:MFS family permease